jgi:hypothetical protein
MRILKRYRMMKFSLSASVRTADKPDIAPYAANAVPVMIPGASAGVGGHLI